MKRIILDTNVYDLILKELNLEEIMLKKKKMQLIFYGLDIIRKELRDIPKNRKEVINNKFLKLRTSLLSIYDLLIGGHFYSIDGKIKHIAEQYYVAYHVLGGNIPKQEIMNDFIIVAAASAHNMDILISEDNKTMRSPLSLKVYNSVNRINNVKNPDFMGFKEFKIILRGVNLD